MCIICLYRRLDVFVVRMGLRSVGKEVIRLIGPESPNRNVNPLSWYTHVLVSAWRKEYRPRRVGIR
jgi:hypothetical protein